MSQVVTETFLGTKPRTYQKTHSWLTFSADLRASSPALWMALGEAQSKCQHLAGVPLRPETAEELHTVYLAKGLMATTAIEGNTLTEEEVRERIEGRLNLPPSKEYLGREIDNILRVTNTILEEVAHGKTTVLSAAQIEDFNREVLKELSVPDYAVPGEFRKCSVTVGNYRGAPAEDCAFLLKKMCQWIAGDEFTSAPGQEIAYGLLKAIIAHLYIAWIHPFGDGNGRTARLVEVKLLLEAGVPSAAAHLLSNHYNETRQEYYRQLDAASKSGGNIIPFVDYAIRGFVDQIRRQIEIVRDQQWDVAWRNFVYGLFRELRSRAGHRRRRLILAISQQPNVVPVSGIRHLSSDLAEEYAGKTPKTVTRDLNELERMGLIEFTLGGVRARKEIMLRFLPVCRHQP